MVLFSLLSFLPFLLPSSHLPLCPPPIVCHCLSLRLYHQFSSLTFPYSFLFFFIPPPSAFTLTFYLFLLFSPLFPLLPWSLHPLSNPSSTPDTFIHLPFTIYFLISFFLASIITSLISSLPPVSDPLSTFSSSPSTHFKFSLIYSFLHYILTTVFLLSFPLSLSFPSTPPLFLPRKG